MTATVPAPERAHDGLSRRRILQGAAWAAPAIVLATAVPAAAGSLATAYPTLAASFDWSIKNPGNESKTDATLTIIRQDNNSVHSVRIDSVVVHFDSSAKGGSQASGAGVATTGWTFDAANSFIPTGSSSTTAGYATLLPPAGTVLSSSFSSIQVTFFLQRFNGITSIELNGTASDGTPLDITLTRPA